MSRTWIIILMTLITGIGIYLVPQLEFETDLSGIRLAADSEVEKYKALNQHYPEQSENSLIILEHENTWSTYQDFLLLDSITQYIGAFEEVISVSSISNIHIPKNGRFGPENTPYIPLDDSLKFEQWTKSNNHYPDVQEKFLSKNKKYTILYVDSPSGLEDHTQKAIHSYNNQATKCNLIVLQKDTLESQLQDELATESIILGVICISFILFIFYFFTKSLRGLGLISLTILFNISLTVIFMFIVGIPFNMQMIALPCLIIIFSFTDLMHILYHQSEIATTTEAELAKKPKLMAVLGKPIFLTSLSNVFGFLIFLGLSRNEDLTHLSLVAIASITIAYLSSRFLVIHLVRQDVRYIDSAIKQSVQSFCKKITDRSKPKKTTLTFILLGILFGLTAWLFSTFKIDTTTTALFANDSELSRGHTIISDHFFGSNTLEIAIEYTDEHQLWERENLDKIEKIERTLQTLFHPLYTISPATIVKRNHRYRVNGLQSAYSIPKKITPSTIQNLNQYYSQWGGSQVIGMNKDVGKIIIGYKQAGLHESLRLYEELSRVLLKLSNDKIKFSLTGPAYLIDKGTYTFTRNLITGWLTGVLLSVLLIGFILRSFIKGLMLLLVNMIPIILVVVLMPKFGLEINPQSLFLLTILAGLCVDDSIYIMLQGKKREIGYFPVLVTSVVLTGGFISFGFSNLTWLSPFAWIFLIGIMAALLLDLFVLPRYTKPSDE